MARLRRNAKLTKDQVVHFPDDEVKFPHGPPPDASTDMKVVRRSLNEYGEPVVMVLDKTNSLTTFWVSDLATGRRPVMRRGRKVLPLPTDPTAAGPRPARLAAG